MVCSSSSADTVAAPAFLHMHITEPEQTRFGIVNVSADHLQYVAALGKI